MVDACEEWLFEFSDDVSEEALDALVRKHVEDLAKVVEVSKLFDDKAVTSRSFNRARGSPWDEKTCALAAHDGRVDALERTRANGCADISRSSRIARESLEFADVQLRAARDGHLE
ncbi:hypothetical protein CTAYLR_005574 [Chrysophaeum taylorii]|uniref:Uncharacterized protein n=1 Tax=Chrysophaeum taylorii TaxID=2483200 RepID=A0AAD7U465_9STRA|nr:hypothetical protein CTAYLR_005574 [Chrysophaeum taylorii]